MKKKHNHFDYNKTVITINMIEGAIERINYTTEMFDWRRQGLQIFDLWIED